MEERIVKRPTVEHDLGFVWFSIHCGFGLDCRVRRDFIHFDKLLAGGRKKKKEENKQGRTCL